PDEKVDLVCQLIYYNPTGYYSNAQKLYKAIKDEGYHFLYKKIHEWLECQQQYQIYKPSPKHITRASYEKTYKAVLNIVDCASRYKASPRLLQTDNGQEWISKTSRIMEEHGIVIQVIGLYSHHSTAIVERFNKTLAEMLYKIQYSIE
ncbi:35657_t:CDS:2, partial [Racocetra persica]